jgi:hypothetical protein
VPVVLRLETLRRKDLHVWSLVGYEAKIELIILTLGSQAWEHS